MSHTAFKVDKNPLAKDDPRYAKRLDSQHRLVLAPGLIVTGAVGGAFMALPFAARQEGLPLLSLPVGVMSVFVLIGLGFMVLALVQGAWRFIPAFWSLHTSLDELSDSQRLLWQTLEIGLGILGFGLGVAVAYLLI
jgi:hypothetical protein